MSILENSSHNHSYYIQYEKVYQLSLELGQQLHQQQERTALATQRIQQLAVKKVLHRREHRSSETK